MNNNSNNNNNIDYTISYSFEDTDALDGGEDGLRVVRTILENAQLFMHPDRYLPTHLPTYLPTYLPNCTLFTLRLH